MFFFFAEAPITAEVTLVEECGNYNDVHKPTNTDENSGIIFSAFQQYHGNKPNINKAEPLSITRECKPNEREAVYYVGFQNMCNSTCEDACIALLQNDQARNFIDPCKTICRDSSMQRGFILSELHNVTLHAIARDMEAESGLIKDSISIMLRSGRLTDLKIVVGEFDYDKMHPFDKGSPFCRERI